MSDTQAARALAEEVRTASLRGQRRSWRKVTTILSTFGLYKLTDASRGRIAEALCDAGLTVDPPFSEVSRAGTVRLTVADETAGPAAQVSGQLPPGVTRWAVQEGGLLGDPRERKGESVFLVDVDVELAESPIAGLRTALSGLLLGMTAETLDDVLTADAQAAFKARGGDALRRASVYQLAPLAADALGEQSKVIGFTARLVELAVGPNWVLTVRYPRHLVRNGKSDADAGHPQDVEHYVGAVSGAGLPAAASASELALAVVNTSLYSFSATKEELASWLDTWRLEDAKDTSPGRDLLVNLQTAISLVTDRLRPLQHPSATAWLHAGHAGLARDVGELIARELGDLQALSDATGSALAHAKQGQTERYQRNLAELAAVLLAPGLVAAVFGANDRLGDSWADLPVLLVLMCLAAVASVVIIRRRFVHDAGH